MDEVKALQDELEAVKQQLWDAEQSSGEARLLKQQLESTRERLRQLEETQDGLATNPWSTGSNRSIYQERRSSIDTTISSTSGSRAQLLAQEEELRATKRELSAVKQQLNDAVTLASSQTRMGELQNAGGSQTFLMQADNSSGVDVIQKVNAVNEEIFQVAAYLGEVLFYEVLTPGGDRQEHRQRAINASYEGAKNMLGDKLANALAQASVKEPKDEINPLLVQIVMQIALTNWCGIFGRRWTSFKKVDREPSGGGARRDQQRDSANTAGVSSQADYDKFISELYDKIRDHGTYLFSLTDDKYH
jgi:DNA repair exonuclease SbcCD ATPase subunit